MQGFYTHVLLVVFAVVPEVGAGLNRVGQRVRVLLVDDGEPFVPGSDVPCVFASAGHKQDGMRSQVGIPVHADGIVAYGGRLLAHYRQASQVDPHLEGIVGNVLQVGRQREVRDVHAVEGLEGTHADALDGAGQGEVVEVRAAGKRLVADAGHGVGRAVVFNRLGDGQHCIRAVGIHLDGAVAVVNVARISLARLGFLVGDAVPYVQAFLRLRAEHACGQAALQVTHDVREPAPCLALAVVVGNAGNVHDVERGVVGGDGLPVEGTVCHERTGDGVAIDVGQAAVVQRAVAQVLHTGTQFHFLHVLAEQRIMGAYHVGGQRLQRVGGHYLCDEGQILAEPVAPCHAVHLREDIAVVVDGQHAVGINGPKAVLADGAAHRQ